MENIKNCSINKEKLWRAYLRVRREGKLENIEVEYLTDSERQEILKNDTRLISWINLLCNELVKIEELLLDLEKDGITKRLGI